MSEDGRMLVLNVEISEENVNAFHKALAKILEQRSESGRVDWSKIAVLGVDERLMREADVMAALCTPSRNPITSVEWQRLAQAPWPSEEDEELLSLEDLRTLDPVRAQEEMRKIMEGDPESDKPFTGLSDIIDEQQYAIELPLAVELPVMEEEDA